MNVQREVLMAPGGPTVRVVVPSTVTESITFGESFACAEAKLANRKMQEAVAGWE